MTASQLIGLAFVLLGVAALALRRDEFAVGFRFANDATLLLIGVSCMLIGGVLWLLSQLNSSVEH